MGGSAGHGRNSGRIGYADIAVDCLQEADQTRLQVPGQYSWRDGHIGRLALVENVWPTTRLLDRGYEGVIATWQGWRCR